MLNRKTHSCPVSGPHSQNCHFFSFVFNFVRPSRCDVMLNNSGINKRVKMKLEGNLMTSRLRLLGWDDGR